MMEGISVLQDLSPDGGYDSFAKVLVTRAVCGSAGAPVEYSCSHL